jgi:hypothetical protein
MSKYMTLAGVSEMLVLALLAGSQQFENSMSLVHQFRFAGADRRWLDHEAGSNQLKSQKKANKKPRQKAKKTKSQDSHI